MRLSRYRWQGIDAMGKPRSGHRVTSSASDVIDWLKSQQIVATKLSKRRAPFWVQYSHRATASDITQLTRQLAVMLQTGVPIVTALKLIAASYRKREVSLIIGQIAAAIESGTPLSSAMRASSTLFDNLYIDLIASGEYSGSLEEVMLSLADYRERSKQLKTQVTKALIYPGMIIITALGVTYLMLAMVIPQFESMLRGFGGQLPWFTQSVIQLSQWTEQYSLILLLTLAGASWGIRHWIRRSQRAQIITWKGILKTPVIGSILLKAAMARFSRTLATTIKAGVPIVSAIQNSAATSGNAYHHQAITQIYLDIRGGIALHTAMRTSGAIPEQMVQMVMVGEQSGQLEEMLNRCASLYQTEVEERVDSLGKVMEPVIILGLGGLIGGLILAMYLPIFNLMNVLG
ncbi:type II secretion system F family protein [Vibrio sp. WXL103]|uniref:type II secretion system F family protein n=1 Tax=Vibrio sp. WXL103 TaxID=3450710 RepID=UPI003EC5D933